MSDLMCKEVFFLPVSVYQGLNMTWHEVVFMKAADCIMYVR